MSNPYAGIVADPLYRELASATPERVAIGGALITMVEPHHGFEAEYNRWYEDDHFYSGAMVGPWSFSGRRWVATKDLRDLRFPDQQSIANPVTDGCYISTYFVLAPHFEHYIQWATATMHDYLTPQGRGFSHRDQILTTFATFEFSVIADKEKFLQPHHLLDYPFGGMVVEVVRTRELADRGAVVSRLRDVEIPRELARAAATATVAFAPGPGLHSMSNGEEYLVLLWFTEANPRDTWARFRSHDRLASEAGGELLFCAPFVPTIPGTDRYVAELR